MCGKSLRRAIDLVAHGAGDVPLTADVRPGDIAKVFTALDKEQDMRWGYELSGKNLLYNARSETWTSKATFLDNKPCLVPVTGFYEGGKLFVPINPEQQENLYLAGLYKNNRYVILTQEAAKTKIVPFYHRAPIVLEQKEQGGLWLSSLLLPDFTNRVDLQIHEGLYKVA